jgi:FKBP-type peptidyl-prolyl cis-trans isomerase FkpA
MSKPYRALLVCALATLAAACNKAGDHDAAQGAAAAPADLSTDAQKLGYAIGYNIGHNLAQIPKGDVDLPSLEKGLQESFAGQPPRLADKDREQVLAAEMRKVQQAKMEERKQLADKNQQDSDKFLAENAKKPGVKTTASGLQYEVITEGKGPHPTKDDKVTVNYKGTLIDGTVFDSSYDRGQPATFPLANVIPGWTEGLQLMEPGAKYKFYIPPQLAYGERGAGAKIGPNQALIFEVELLKVEKGDTAAQPQSESGAKANAKAGSKKN